jgi:hypothetical protein
MNASPRKIVFGWISFYASLGLFSTLMVALIFYLPIFKTVLFPKINIYLFWVILYSHYYYSLAIIILVSRVISSLNPIILCGCWMLTSMLPGAPNDIFWRLYDRIVHYEQLGELLIFLLKPKVDIFFYRRIELVTSKLAGLYIIGSLLYLRNPRLYRFNFHASRV